MVDYIIYESNDFDLDCVDVNGDGSLSILDLVATIGVILGRSDTSDAASSVKLIQSSNGLSFKANGHVAGFQITLKHGPNFLIELNDNAWIANYSTNGNTSILVILNPSDNELFSCNDQFEILEIIAANSNGQIDAMIVKKFSVSDAYPNPFNPTTSMEVVMSLAGEMNVICLLYTSPSPRDATLSRMQSSA